MQIQCPACRAKILADDVDLSSKLAKCRGCNNVFEFAVSGPSAFSGEVPRPTKFKVREQPEELEISWRWFTPAHIGLAVFCTAWDAFLVFWYSVAFRTGAPWIMKVFPIGHLAVGVGMTYAALVGFWNRTTIRLTRDRLEIAHGPLPWRGNRSIPAGDLRRVYASLRPNYRRNNMPVFQLLAATRSGEEIRLLSALDDEVQARFLQAKIGTYLGLDASRLPGQL